MKKSRHNRSRTAPGAGQGEVASLDQASEHGYRMLFEANPHPMWVFDRHTLGFLAVNDAAVESYGYTRDEFLGMTVKDIRPEEDVPALLESLSRPSLHKTSQTANSTHRCLAGPGKGGVWRHRKKDGTVIDVEITAHDVVFGGRARGLTDGGRRSQ